MISVIIPAYNEEGNIEKTVTVFNRILNENNINHEILIVNDNSSDNTGKVDKTLLFRGMTIEKFPLCVKEKVTTTYVASGWIAVQRFFRNIRK